MKHYHEETNVKKLKYQPNESAILEETSQEIYIPSGSCVHVTVPNLHGGELTMKFY